MVSVNHLLLVASLLAATNLSGVWTLELNPDFGGNEDKIDCTFKHKGATLSVDCGGAPITGTIDGKGVTLRVPTGRANELTATMTGTLNDAETVITGTWHLADDAGKREGHFTARKH